MNGARELFAMRRAGYKPAFVWVSDFPGPLIDSVTVRLNDETPELCDFRFLVGVVAIVEGADASRVARIAKACSAHARRVIASVLAPINQYRWEVTSVNDSEGVLTWPT